MVTIIAVADKNFIFWKYTVDYLNRWFRKILGHKRVSKSGNKIKIRFSYFFLSEHHFRKLTYPTIQVCDHFASRYERQALIIHEYSCMSKWFYMVDTCIGMKISQKLAKISLFTKISQLNMPVCLEHHH